MATVTFAGAVALASSIAMGGCFGLFIPTDRNPCAQAERHVKECLGSEVLGGSDQGTCGSAVTACTSACINAASCDELVDAFSGPPTGVSKAFLDCTAPCAEAR